MGNPSFKRYSTEMGELYWPNSNYGNARTLKTYAGYPLNKPVQAVIPHGVFYEGEAYDERFAIFPGEAKAPVPCVLNYPAHRDKPWSEFKEVVPMAAPFVYALQVYPHNPVRRGSIIMPQHSTTLYDQEFDWPLFARLCNDQIPRPRTYLAYWEDLQRGVADYRTAGRSRPAGMCRTRSS